LAPCGIGAKACTLGHEKACFTSVFRFLQKRGGIFNDAAFTAGDFFDWHGTHSFLPIISRNPVRCILRHTGNFRKGDFAQRNTLTFATITLKNVRPEEFRTHG